MAPKLGNTIYGFQSNSMFAYFSLLAFFVLFVMQAYLPGLALADFENPPTLQAGSILEPEIHKGKYHAVENNVKNDGLFNHYIVKSQFGEFRASSTIDLRVLVQEINVLSEIVKVKTDETLTKSLKQSAEKSVTGVKSLATDPQGTLASAGAGIGNLFNTAKETVGKRELTNEEDSRVEQIAGISKSKGVIANKYGVSVYSRNVALQKELDRLARADFLGGLGIGAAQGAIPGAGGLVLTASGATRLLNEVVNTTSAAELWLQNKNKLLAMGFNPDTVELFLNNPVFSPAHQTTLVAALTELEGVANRELFIKVALQASEVGMANVVTRIAMMSAGYQKNISPLKSFIPLARITCAIGKDGSVIVLLPADYIIWTQRIADMVFSLKEKQGSSPESVGFKIWVLGKFSKRAQSELDTMGMNIRTGVAKQLSFSN